jgi:subtilisin family serine protease
MLGTRRSAALTAVAASAVLAIGTTLTQGAAVAAPQVHQAGATDVGTQKVIVVLRDQLTSTPVRRSDMDARTSAARSSQNDVLGELAGPDASHVTHLTVGNAFIATVTADQAAALAANPAVASVVKDSSIALSPATPTAPGTGGSGATAPSGPATYDNTPDAICPTDPAKPLLEPEALRTMHVVGTTGTGGDAGAQALTTGAGTKVAYIADGIDINNPDFIRADGSHVIVDYQDFSGEGTNTPTGGGEAFGDASAIAAQGRQSYDLSTFVNPAYPLPAGCNISILGVAPGASIVAIKAGGEFLTNSSILQAIDYSVRVDHVNVINESFGLSEFPDSSSRNAIQLFNDQAVAAGVTITESTGDGGITGTIGSDSQDPLVISAAATTDSQLYAQTGYAGARRFGNGKWVNNNISALSSSGFTNFGRTVDVVAPGESDWALCTPDPQYASCTNFRGGRSNIEAFGGTSQSAPLTAGVAALVISAYRTTHQGANPTPALVKQLITGTATDLGMPPDEQGSGLVNARAAVEAAMTYRGSSGAPAGLASNIVTSENQFTLSGKPGTSQHHSVTVTNVGTHPVTVHAGTRSFSTISASSQNVPFSATTGPTFAYPTNGAPWAYQQVTFQVPSGTDRLLTRTAWPGAGPAGIVRVSLFAPDGTYAANSRPQGGTATPNYANVDVRKPAAGTWTAVFYSAQAGGFNGTVQFSSTYERAVSTGSVSPATFTVQPGSSKDVKFAYTMPAKASGDRSVALTLATSEGRQTSVSAVIRTEIDTEHGHGAYSGVVTGGNARGVTPGETFSYQFDVPKRWDDLEVSTEFANNLDSVVDLVLIDPNGELSDVVSNEALDDTATGLTLTKDMQSFTADPVPGLWHMVVVVQNPVSGNNIEQPFTGHVTDDGVGVNRHQLPNSNSTKLTVGVPATYDVKVTNPGVQPIFVGVDPRLEKTVTLRAVPIQGDETFALPPDPSVEPIYNAPPDTQSLTVTAQSTTPAQLELQGSAAGFDIFGDLLSAQQGSTLSVAKVSEAGNGDYVTRGIWFTNMQQIGPFPEEAPAGQSTLSASMRTFAFDSTVTSEAGDPYGNSVDPNNDGFGNPVRIGPGETQTISVTITPTTRGSASGILNLVTVPNLPTGGGGLPFTSTGEVVATVPYKYKAG